MLVYYAHSMHIYNSPQEKRDIELLKRLGFTIFNPNSPAIEIGVQEYKKLHGDDKVMDYFKEILDECDCLAFRSHFDGSIPSGVGFEINYMKEKNKPIFELPSLIKRRFLDVDDTREILKLNGQR